MYSVAYLTFLKKGTRKFANYIHKQITILITAIIHHNLFKYDGRLHRFQNQCIGSVRTVGQAQLHPGLHHPTGHCGIQYAIYIIRMLVQLRIETDSLLLPSFKTYCVAMTCPSSDGKVIATR